MDKSVDILHSKSNSQVNIVCSLFDGLNMPTSKLELF